jgi:hypothetical protein
LGLIGWPLDFIGVDLIVEETVRRGDVPLTLWSDSSDGLLWMMVICEVVELIEMLEAEKK